MSFHPNTSFERKEDIPELLAHFKSRLRLITRKLICKTFAFVSSTIRGLEMSRTFQLVQKIMFIRKNISAVKIPEDFLSQELIHMAFL